MYKILLFCFAVLFFQGDDASFVWKEQTKLTWEDFKGAPNYSSGAVAVTASGITFSYSIKKTDAEVVSFKTSIKAHFYLNKSWRKKDEVNTYILSHEQLHFDITELHVRLFKQKVAKLKPIHNLVAVLQGYHESINDDLKKMQHKYDDETDSSINVVQQAKWQSYIEKELKQLDKYKS